MSDMDTLEKTIGTILVKLNMNFYEERGIKFRAGHHGTWVEMVIIDVFWGARDNSVGTIDDLEMHIEGNSLKPSEPVKKYQTLGTLHNKNNRANAGGDSMDDFEMNFP